MIALDDEQKITVHEKISGVLKSHQIAGVKFMFQACFEAYAENKYGGCILAHSMGLG